MKFGAGNSSDFPPLLNEMAGHKMIRAQFPQLGLFLGAALLGQRAAGMEAAA